MARYSASAEDLETVDCFLYFQDIKELSRKTQKLVMDRLVSTQPAQSESQKAFSWREQSAEKK
jgi:hypothetical protein